MALLAIDIVRDGEQIDRDCRSCGRRVRPFDWHSTSDGLPVAYGGRHLPVIVTRPSCPELYNVFTCYEATGAVRAVPAVDDAQADNVIWAEIFTPATLARAILAHLIGLDVPTELWKHFTLDIIVDLTTNDTGEWQLRVDDILDWLDTNG